MQNCDKCGVPLHWHKDAPESVRESARQEELRRYTLRGFRDSHMFDTISLIDDGAFRVMFEGVWYAVKIIRQSP